MLLSLLASRPRWGSGVVWFGVALGLGSCKISQPSFDPPDACAIGDLCGDAGTSEAVGTMAVAPVTTTTAPPRMDAGAPPVGICPGECLPDDPAAKECAEPVVIELQFASQLVGDGGALSSEVDASLASSDAALLDASMTSESPDAAVLDAAADASTDGSGGLVGDAAGRTLDVVDQVSGDKNTDDKVPLSCQLVALKESVTAGCAPSGSGVEGSVCTSARDCAAGFGCVGKVGAGQCLPYCCGGDDVCGPNRYCDKRPMRSLEFDDTTNTLPDIPVCVAAEQCSLDVAPEGDQSDAKGNEPNSCPDGSACTIVRANTTACRPMGKGIEGESCPCSGGFFCSRSTNTCLKLCDTTDPTSCGQRECQPGPSGFPQNWGLCVGG